MKKILYFDAFNGAAGDMVLGGLLDLGVPMEHLESELRKLGLSGYLLHVETVDREGLFARNFKVLLDSDETQ
ncbi:nickel insertion protein, partial [Salmonella enterica]|uniref:nickel insertion protein n=1 Tax=Salmonella enterica TaxID=28901 RepID=UPI0032994B81